MACRIVHVSFAAPSKSVAGLRRWATVSGCTADNTTCAESVTMTARVRRPYVASTSVPRSRAVLHEPLDGSGFGTDDGDDAIGGNDVAESDVDQLYVHRDPPLLRSYGPPSTEALQKLRPLTGT